MAEILGLGCTHRPVMLRRDEDWTVIGGHLDVFDAEVDRIHGYVEQQQTRGSP